jgi:photosystem II stability/assembly factor-like uncharacterized protein
MRQEFWTKMTRCRLPVWAVGLIFSFLFSFRAGAQTSAPYSWKNVQIVGGGFVDGIIYHPKTPGVRYCRTDMGGAYRWDETAKRWAPMLDWVSYADRNLMGIESIAVDPNDPNFVILACGTYTNPRTPNGAILRSDDRGMTFQRTDVPFKFGGNENGRGNGERMAVDPNNGNIIYLGTRLNGLWKSIDKGKTWSQVQSFPDVTEGQANSQGADSMQQRRAFFMNRGSGVVVCLFDPAHRSSGGPSTVYVAVSLMGRDNFYKSSDEGQTWQAVPGSPTAYRPTHAVIAAGGMIYLSYGDNGGPRKMTNGAVWKFDTNTGEWTDITPDKPVAGKREFGYAAVAVDAQHPGTVIASSFGRSASGGEELFRSLDGGKDWKPVLATSRYDDAAAPYVSHTEIHWLFDIEIDPFDSGHALFTTGYGGHETFDLGDADAGRPVSWTVMSTGVEETVGLELLSPPKGAQLISAIGDYGGFVHWDLDKPVREGNFINPHFGNTDGVACAEHDPAIIVRVGAASHNVQGQNIGYSLDSGRSWQPPVTMPQLNSQHGYIAVSADGDTWIWTPQRSIVFVTHDRGASWQPARGIAANLRVIADKVNDAKFYALDLREGMLYSSVDSGNSFTKKALPGVVALPKAGGGGGGIPSPDRGDTRGGQDRVYAAPGHEGDLWIAAWDGLYHSTNAGKGFSKMGKVEEIHAFGFGKGAPGSAYSALYLVGVVKGVRGIFRSDDGARDWVRINDDQHQWGLVLQVAGDPKKYGRVYVGTHGRGIFYGDPVK